MKYVYPIAALIVFLMIIGGLIYSANKDNTPTKVEIGMTLEEVIQVRGYPNTWKYVRYSDPKDPVPGGPPSMEYLYDGRRIYSSAVAKYYYSKGEMRFLLFIDDKLERIYDYDIEEKGKSKKIDDESFDDFRDISDEQILFEQIGSG